MPRQRAADFLSERASDGKLETSYPLGGQWADVRAAVPRLVSVAVSRGLEILGRRLPGFAGHDAVIAAPETRGSAPVRVERNHDTRQSASHANLYPVGEGAGYAGGIVSSAIDGMKTAHVTIERFTSRQ